MKHANRLIDTIGDRNPPVSPKVIDGGGFSTTSAVADTEIEAPKEDAIDPVALVGVENQGTQYMGERRRKIHRGETSR